MSDEVDIRMVVDLYVAGANGDVSKLRDAFHPDATMTGRIGSGRDTFTPIADFIAMVGRNPGLAGPNYAWEIRSIDVRVAPLAAQTVEKREKKPLSPAAKRALEAMSRLRSPESD